MGEDLALIDFLDKDTDIRKDSKETFYLFDPRMGSVISQEHDAFDFSSTEGSFDLSCEHFDQNITSIRLFTQKIEDEEVLKKISLTFCDGTEKSVSTQVANYNTTYRLTFTTDTDSRKVLLVSGPMGGYWDSPEILFRLIFLLSDGDILSFQNEDLPERRRVLEQSILHSLPASVHSANLRWMGICGDVLNTSQCGDSIISNLKFKFSSLSDKNN